MKSTVVLALALGACSTRQTFVEPDPSWERMLTQRRADPFESSTVFRDGRTMQTPPAGTIDRARVLGPPALVHGVDAEGRLATTLPVTVDRALLERGRARFDTICANCHGVLGDGQSPVADAMQLRRPPSLHEARLLAAPAGHFFQVITEGYGLMPALAPYVPIGDRWAIVAYVQALQLSQRAPVAALPADVRDALAREAQP